MFDLEYFFMCPFSIVVATTAMTFGIGGAVMFSPLFILAFPLIGVKTLDPVRAAHGYISEARFHATVLPPHTPHRPNCSGARACMSCTPTPQATAFGAALLTEAAGFASGLTGYSYQKLIDWKSGGLLLMMGVPMSVMGTLVKHKLSKALLVLVFAIGMVLLAGYVVWHRKAEPNDDARARKISKHNAHVGESGHTDIDTAALMRAASGLDSHELRTQSDAGAHAGTSAGFDSAKLRLESMEYGDTSGDDRNHTTRETESGRLIRVSKERRESTFWDRQLVDRAGRVYTYMVCNPVSGMVLIMVGAFMTGLISVGIGETTVSILHSKCKIPMRVAAATSVFVTFVVVMASALTDIVVEGVDGIPWPLVAFTVPGVLIGGQLGVQVSAHVKSSTSEVALVVILLVLGLLMGLQSLHAYGVLDF